jgi:hypothetical protein
MLMSMLNVSIEYSICERGREGSFAPAGEQKRMVFASRALLNALDFDHWSAGFSSTTCRTMQSEIGALPALRR